MLSRQLFYDRTENGLINQRIVTALFSFAQQLDLTVEQKQHFLNALLLQAKKLLAVWIHFDRFRREVERLTPLAPIHDENKPEQHLAITYSQELYLEFDEFLVQYKSSLDYLSKFPVAFYGREKWNARSFGEKGQRIVKLFRNILADDKKFLADDFEKKIFQPHRSDIEDVVKARDKINHFLEGGIPFENFTVIGFRKADKVTYQTPLWTAEQTIVDFMEITFHNHLSFCEDFIVFFLGIHLKPGFGFLRRPVPTGSTTSPFKLIPEALLPAFLEDGELVEARAVDK